MYKIAGECLFTKVCSDRKKGNDFRLKEVRFKLNIRKKFFTRIVRHVNRLPKEVMEASTLKVFKDRLSNMI